MAKKYNYSFFQEELVWMAMISYVALFVVKSDWGKENLGSWQLTVKQGVATTLVVLSILSGKRGYEFLRQKLAKKVEEKDIEEKE